MRRRLVDHELLADSARCKISNLVAFYAETRVVVERLDACEELCQFLVAQAVVDENDLGYAAASVRRHRGGDRLTLALAEVLLGDLQPVGDAVEEGEVRLAGHTSPLEEAEARVT